MPGRTWQVLLLTAGRAEVLATTGADVQVSGFRGALTSSCRRPPPRRGGGPVIETQLSVLRVLLWRHGGLEMATGGGPANATRRVLTFRQSPETHFRKRWGVADHARALGMTPDRPHDLCVRLLGKPTTLD